MLGGAGMSEATYIESLCARLAGSPDAVVLRHDGADVTAAALLARIHRLARALAALGIGPGRLVAMFAPTVPDALALRYAAHLLGAATVYLSAPPSAAARAALVAQMAPDLLVAFPQTAGLLPPDIAAPLASLGAVPGIATRLDVLAEAQPAGPLPCAARPEYLAVIVSSGGTTGVPKGSWRDFRRYTAMVSRPSPPDRRQLLNGRLPYLSQVLADMTLLGGGCLVLQPGFDPAATLAAIEADGITDLFLVEPQLFTLMDHPDLGRHDLSSLRALVHIGASAPPVLRRRARERLGPRIAHVYGASEMGLVSVLPPGSDDTASAGTVLPGVDIRFRLPGGDLAPPGEPGGIEVRSPAMSRGYRNRPAEEAAAFHDGWYRTGDLGRLDADGRLHVLGRTADIAFAGGVMASPTLMEDCLCALICVRYAVVVVAPGQARRVAACEPWAGGTVDEAACAAAIAARFGAAIAATLTVMPLDRMPLTEQGKPDRSAILRQVGLS